MLHTTTHTRIHLVSTTDDTIAFSRTPCDCCGDRLGGERHEVEAVGLNVATRKVEVLDTLEVCTACLITHA